MSMFTRTKRPTPTAAPEPVKAPVVSYSNPSASVTVVRRGNLWRLLVRAQNGCEGAFDFDNRKAAVVAAEWLAYQNLTGVGSKSLGLDWYAFVDAINDGRERPTEQRALTLDPADMPDIACLPDEVSLEIIEIVIGKAVKTKHGRTMLRRMCRDYETLEKADLIRKESK
jgi:hypothetical protein